MSEFHKALNEVQALHDKKRQDYGSDTEPFANVIEGANFAGLPHWVAALIRANDKMGRLSNVAQGRELANDSVEDAFLDLATYALIGLCLYRRAYGHEQAITEFIGKLTKCACGDYILPFGVDSRVSTTDGEHSVGSCVMTPVATLADRIASLTGIEPSAWPEPVSDD
jgi:hypothetical protein